MKEFARIIRNTWYLSKQQCSLVFLGTAWGEATAIKEGGEERCCQLTKEEGTVHHQRAKMWVLVLHFLLQHNLPLEHLICFVSGRPVFDCVIFRSFFIV